MSKSMNRRKSIRKSKGSINLPPPGPRLRFQWSVLASGWSLNEESSTSSIVTDRSGISSLRSDQRSIGRSSPFTSSTSNLESFSLPSLQKKHRSPISNEQQSNQKESVSLPLLISYKQVHRPPSLKIHVPDRRMTLAIEPSSFDGLSFSRKRKVSFASMISAVSTDVYSVNSCNSSFISNSLSTKNVKHSMKPKKRFFCEKQRTNLNLIEVCS